jgi:hypothetical protein
MSAEALERMRENAGAIRRLGYPATASDIELLLDVADKAAKRHGPHDVYAEPWCLCGEANCPIRVALDALEASP